MIASVGLSFPNNVQLFLVDNVPSPPAVLEMVMQGRLRAAAVNAAAVCSLFHLQSAVVKALHNEAHGAMSTKGVFSEIVYCLSASRNITDSLKKFGVSESTTKLALVFVDPTEEDLAALQQIGGELKDISELDALDEARQTHLRSLFKIPAAEEAMYGLESSIISRVAAKECN